MDLSKIDLLILNSFIEYPEKILRLPDTKLSMSDIRYFLKDNYATKGWLSKSWEQILPNRIEKLIDSGILQTVGEQFKGRRKILRINPAKYPSIRQRVIADLVMIDDMWDTFGREIYNGQFERLRK